MKMQKPSQYLSLAVACLALSGAALAADKPAQLSDTQLENVKAGGGFRSQNRTSWRVGSVELSDTQLENVTAGWWGGNVGDHRYRRSPW